MQQERAGVSAPARSASLLKEQPWLAGFLREGVLHIARGVLEVAYRLLAFPLHLIDLPLTLRLLVVGEVAQTLLDLPFALIEHPFGAIAAATVGHGRNLLCCE